MTFSAVDACDEVRDIMARSEHHVTFEPVKGFSEGSAVNPVLQEINDRVVQVWPELVFVSVAADMLAVMQDEKRCFENNISSDMQSFVRQNCHKFMDAIQEDIAIKTAVKDVLSFVTGTCGYTCYDGCAQDKKRALDIDICSLWRDVEKLEREKAARMKAVRTLLKKVREREIEGFAKEGLRDIECVNGAMKVMLGADAEVMPSGASYEYVVLKFINEGIRRMAGNDASVSQKVSRMIGKTLRDLRKDTVETLTFWHDLEQCDFWRAHGGIFFPKDLCPGSIARNIGRAEVSKTLLTSGSVEWCVWRSGEAADALSDILQCGVDVSRNTSCLMTPWGLITTVIHFLYLQCAQKDAITRLERIVNDFIVREGRQGHVFVNYAVRNLLCMAAKIFFKK